MVVIKDKDSGEQIWRSPAATLAGASLRRARLRYAALRDADLRGTDLQGANLWGADLQEADLRDADLRGAVLWNADLTGADLRGANLEGALLCRANLQNAHLGGAWLKNAKSDELTRWPAGIDLRHEQVEVLSSSDPRSLHGIDSQGTNPTANLLRERIAAHTRPRSTGAYAASMPDEYAPSVPDLRAEPAPPTVPWSRSYRLDVGG